MLYKTLCLVLAAQASAFQLASPVSSRSVVRRSRSPVAMDGLVDAAQHVDTAQQIFVLVADKVDDEKGNRRDNMGPFVIEYLVGVFGLKKLAEKTPRRL